MRLQSSLLGGYELGLHGTAEDSFAELRVAIRIPGNAHVTDSMALQEIAFDDVVGAGKWTRRPIHISGNDQHATRPGFSTDARDEVAQRRAIGIVASRNMGNRLKAGLANLLRGLQQPRRRMPRRRAQIDRGGWRKHTAELIELRRRRQCRFERKAPYQRQHV